MKLILTRVALPIHWRREQGYTLQTLIITAVVVLLAVAAGVVIVAVIRSAIDDFAKTPPDIEALCKPWEIYDPELAAIGAGGGEEAFYEIRQTGVGTYSSRFKGSPGAGGVTSSAIGCLAPCYLTIDLNSDLVLDEVVLVGSSEQEALWGREPYTGITGRFRSNGGRNQNYLFKFDTTNRPPSDNYVKTGPLIGFSSGGQEIRLGVAHKYWPAYPEWGADIHTKLEFISGNQNNDSLQRLLELPTVDSIWNRGKLLDVPTDDDLTPLLEPFGWKAPPTFKDGNVAVRVSADGSACEIYNKHTSEIIWDTRGNSNWP